MRFVPLAAIATAIALFTGAQARASSLNDNLGPREIAVGESKRAEAVGALATRLNPAGLSLNNRLVFEGSYGFRGEDGASVVGVSACDSTVPVPGCFYYHYFRAEPTIAGDEVKRRLHEFGIAGARPLNQVLILGTNLRYFDYNSQLTGEEDTSGFTFDTGLIFRATPWANVAAVGYNLLASDSAQYPRAVGTGLALRPGTGALGITADGVWNLDAEDNKGSGRFGGGAEYFLTPGDGQSGYPVRFGGVHDSALDSSYVTGGLGFSSLKVALDVGARMQVSGGDELMVQFALRLFGPDVR